jgi:hypothetical protein
MSQLIRRATEEDASFLAWAILAATRSHVARGHEYIISCPAARVKA